MRRLALMIFLAATVSCGGGGDTGPSTPPVNNPPPVANTTPASIAVQTGDGQPADPGTNVAVKPVVIVKNSAGVALAGVPVAFAVDSGGGALQRSSATTATDASASPGDWKLGVNEGRNVMRATVAALSPAKLVANAVVAPTTVTSRSMGSAGGTITVSRTGLPVDGLQVRIPQNAISSTVAISVSVQSAAALVLPEGVSTPTPLIKVSAPGASLAQPMLIRVLVPEETGSFRYAALWNPVTRKLTPQPTIASNPTSITVAVGEFSTSSAASGSMAFPSSSVATEEMLVVLKGLADILILGDFDTGFRPGIDDWDFARQPILDPAIKGRQRRSTLR